MPLASLGWLAYRPIRQVSGLPAILADVESHLPAGHPYDDPDRITTVHECTHGINSLLRNRYGRPAFYVLNNRAALLDEPAATLAAVAAQVPPSLQGEVYELYLVEPQDGWNDRPSYVFDEWTAYTNGADARQQLGIQDRQETLRYALEFCVYATCVPRAANSTDPQMRGFLRWQIERVTKLGRSDYLDRLRSNADASGLRQYMRDYFGEQWTAATLGF